MSAIVFSVKSWAAWTPGEGEADGWLGDALSEAAPPVMLRRRISRLGRQGLRAAWGLPEKDHARLIFSSRHGEFSRTLSIMDSIAAGTEVSPADFTLSVHHALAGLLSIATHNTEGHTAVSAGDESLFCALLEGAVCQQERPETPILVAHYDEPLPAPYDAFGHGEDETVALALSLDCQGRDYRLSWEPSAQGGTPGFRPAESVLRLLDGVTQSAVFAGERLTWTIERLDAAA